MSGYYNQSLIVYLFIAIVFLLWPYDLVFLKKRNNVRWLENSNGIEFPQQGQVLSLSSTEILCSKLMVGTGFTLEVWAATDNPNQIGPARIVSYSLNTGKRNFTLGQFKKKLIMRLRTTETDLNAIHPHVEVDGVFDFSGPQHIAVAYDFTEQSIFVNGKMRLREDVPGGGFSNWDPSYQLVLGNETTGSRPWNGKIFYIAIHNRALSEQEIRKNYLAGWAREVPLFKEGSSFPDSIVARYLFQEKKGDLVGIDNKTNGSVSLYIPKYLQTPQKTYMSINLKKSLRKMWL